MLSPTPRKLVIARERLDRFHGVDNKWADRASFTEETKISSLSSSKRSTTISMGAVFSVDSIAFSINWDNLSKKMPEKNIPKSKIPNLQEVVMALFLMPCFLLNQQPWTQQSAQMKQRKVGLLALDNTWHVFVCIMILFHNCHLSKLLFSQTGCCAVPFFFHFSLITFCINSRWRSAHLLLFGQTCGCAPTGSVHCLRPCRLHFFGFTRQGFLRRGTLSSVTLNLQGKP